jgi:hypothetical protein
MRDGMKTSASIFKGIPDSTDFCFRPEPGKRPAMAGTLGPRHQHHQMHIYHLWALMNSVKLTPAMQQITRSTAP